MEKNIHYTSITLSSNFFLCLLLLFIFGVLFNIYWCFLFYQYLLIYVYRQIFILKARHQLTYTW